MLKELGFHLSKEEFLAIRFHMSLKDKKSHPLYEDALHCHLRHNVHKADILSYQFVIRIITPLMAIYA